MASGNTDGKIVINSTLDNSELREALKKMDALLDDTNKKLKEQREISKDNATYYKYVREEFGATSQQAEKVYQGIKKQSTEEQRLLQKAQKIKMAKTEVKELIKQNTEREKQQNKELKERNKLLQEEQTNTSNIGETLKKGLKTVGKYSLALIGIRSVYFGLKRAASSWLNSNDENARQLKANLDYMLWAIGYALQPVIKTVVNLLYYALQCVNAITTQFFRWNFLADASVEKFKAMNDSANGISGAMKSILASFDELDVLNNDAGGGLGGFVSPDFDLSNSSLFEDKMYKMKDELKDIDNKADGIGKKFKNWDVSKALKQLEKVGIILKGPVFNPTWNVKKSLEKELEPLPAMIKAGIPLLRNPVYEPNWNLEESLGKELEPLPQQLESGLPVLRNPIYIPNWNLANTLANELVLMKDNLNVWAPSFTNAWVLVLKNMIANQWEGLNAMNENFVAFFSKASENMNAWATGMSNMNGDWLKNWIDNSVIGIKQWLSNFVEGLNSAWEQFKKAMSSMGEEITTAYNSSKFIQITSGAGLALIGLGLTLPSFGKSLPMVSAGLASIGGAVASFTPSFMPALAKGGIAYQPTQAIIGERGREAVLPLENNTEWMDALAERLSDQEININFTGSMAQLVRMLNPEIIKENKRTGRKLIGGMA